MRASSLLRDDGAAIDPRHELARLGASLVVLGATTAVAQRGVPQWEASAFYEINRIEEKLDPVLWGPMQLGSLWGPVAVAAACWRWGDDRRTAVGVLGTGVASWQLAKEVKDRVGRGRPYHLMKKVVRRKGTPTDGLGFPSGHSAVAFSMATVLSPALEPTPGAVAHGLATVVASARIHIGAHFPLDVIGGAALGAAAGSVWNLVAGQRRSRR